MKVILDRRTEEKEIDQMYLLIYDNDGNEYRVSTDKFGGLEIIATDGHLLIQPHQSNHITIITSK